MASGRRALVTAVISVSILAGIIVAGRTEIASARHSVASAIAPAGIEAATPPAALTSTDTQGRRSGTSIRLSIFVLGALVGLAALPRRRGIAPTATRSARAWKAGAASVRGPPVTV